MRTRKKMSRLLSLLLVFSMVSSMLWATPALAADAITNPTLAKAVETVAGTQDAATLTTLDLSNQNIVGDVNVSELKTKYPQLLYVKFDNNSIVNITPANNVRYDYVGTFVTGDGNPASAIRTIDTAGVTMPNYSKNNPTEIDVKTLLEGLVYKVGGTAQSALPEGLFSKYSYKVDTGAETSKNWGEIGVLNLANENKGNHTLTITLSYANSTKTQVISLQFKVTDIAIRLTPASNHGNPGTTMEFIVERLDDDGNVTPITDADNLDDFVVAIEEQVAGGGASGASPAVPPSSGSAATPGVGGTPASVPAGTAPAAPTGSEAAGTGAPAPSAPGIAPATPGTTETAPTAPVAGTTTGGEEATAPGGTPVSEDLASAPVESTTVGTAAAPATGYPQGVTVEKQVENGKLKLLVKLAEGVKIADYTMIVTYKGKPAPATFTVEKLPEIANVTLKTLGNETWDTANKPVYLLAGTTVASLDASKANAGEGSTFVLYNGENPVSADYAKLFEVTGAAQGVTATVVADQANDRLLLTFEANPAATTSQELSGLKLTNNTKTTDKDTDLKVIVLGSTATSYSIYQIPADDDSATIDALQKKVQDKDASFKKVALWNKKANSAGTEYTQDNSVQGVELTEGTKAKLIVTATYGEKEFVVPATSFSKWYDATNSESNFTTSADIKDVAVTANTVAFAGTTALELTAKTPAEKNEGRVVALFADNSTNPISVTVQALATKVKEYIIVPAGTQNVTPVTEPFADWKKKYTTDLTDEQRTVAAGTSTDFDVYAVYDNNTAKKASFENGVPVQAEDASVIVVGAKGNGVFAARGVTPYAENKQTKVTVTDENGKTGEITLQLGLPKINGLNYVVATADGIVKYGTTNEKLQSENKARDLQIPRGLKGYVWVVPTFTDKNLTDTAFEHYTDWAITHGITASSSIQGDNTVDPLGTVQLHQPAVGGPTPDPYQKAFEVNTSAEIKVNEGTPITLKFTIDNATTPTTTLQANGKTYKVGASTEGTLVDNTTLDVTMVAPIVTKVVPQELNTGGTDYEDVSDTNGVTGTLSGKKVVRLKVVYSDGTAVDTMGNNGSNVYAAGTPIVNNLPENYNTDGIQTPTTATGFANLGETEANGLFGYLMGLHPKAYSEAVNPTTGTVSADAWKGNLTDSQIEEVLNKLTKQIHFNVKQNGQASDGLSIKPYKMGEKLIPGYWEITYNKAGTYEIDFSGEILAGPYATSLDTAQNLNAVAGKLKVTVTNPEIKKIYLVAETAPSNPKNTLSFDKASSTYAFNNTQFGDSKVFPKFRVYPVILDNRYVGAEPQNVEFSDVAKTEGLSFVNKADWSAFATGWTTTANGVLQTAQPDEAGNMYLEVTALGDIAKDAAASIEMQLANPIAQTANPTTAYVIPTAPAVTAPAALKVYTNKDAQVMDISATINGANSVVLGNDVTVDVKYIMQDGQTADVGDGNFAGDAGYNAESANALVVTQEGNTLPYTMSHVAGASQLTFTPTATGKYTFKFTTTNIKGAPIPTEPIVRSVTFEVTSKTLPAQTLYYGESKGLEALITGVTYDAVTSDNTNLDAALLAGKTLKMVANTAGTAKLTFTNNGNEVANMTVNMMTATPTTTLVPANTITNPATFANGDKQALVWQTTYQGGGATTMTVVEPVLPEQFKYQDGSADFLTMNTAGVVVANAPAEPAIPVLTAVYEITGKDSTKHTYMAQLIRSQAPQAEHTFAVKENGAEVTALTFTALNEAKTVSLFDKTANAAVSKYTATSANDATVSVQPVGTGVTLTANANGDTTVTFSAYDGASIGVVTIPVKVAVPAPIVRPEPVPVGKITITKQPVSVSVEEGKTATFTVAAATTEAGKTVSYKWQSLEGSVWAEVAGANTATLTLANVTTAMNGKTYRAVAMDTVNTPVNSANAVLTVTAKPASGGGSSGSSGGSGGGGSFGGGGGGAVAPSEYTLTFNVNGGKAIDKVKAKSGTEIDLSKHITTREGYVFDGWFTTDKLTTEVKTVKLTKDITVYAKWTEAKGEAFVDVPADAFYAPAVTWATGKGVTSGTSAQHFTPNAISTRAQMVTFLWRALGEPEAKVQTSTFTDVSKDAYYYKALLWAVENGIAKGTSATTFSPNDKVSRAHAVTFLWRASGELAKSANNPFSDVTKSDYFEPAVLWAVEKGITKGTSATTFSPNLGCTRAEIVTFIYRALQK